jgi:hypothetical protein
LNHHSNWSNPSSGNGFPAHINVLP